MRRSTPWSPQRHIRTLVSITAVVALAWGAMSPAAAAPSDTIQAIPPQVAAPSPPSDLGATAPTHAQVHLTWSDNSGNETGFAIERSSSGSGGPFVALVTTAANVETYDDFNLNGASQYCYRVRSTNSSGPSAWTSTACITTPAEGAFAVDFNGTNAYATFGTATSLSVPAWTVEAWFRRDGTGVGTTTGTNGLTNAVPLVTKGRSESEGSNTDVNWFLGINATNNVLVADFEEGAGGASPGRNHPVSGITQIQNGVWYHAAMTYDGSTWRLYLNGDLETELGVGQPARAPNIQHAAIGSALNSSGSASGFFNGAIDEVRVWNQARTLAQIRSTINQQITGSQSGLVARYGLNEGTGSVVNGGAGTAVKGTLIGSGWAWTTGAPFGLEIDDPPNPATLMAPFDLATGVSTAPTLQVQVSDPNGDPMTVEFWGRPAGEAAADTFTLITIPDTQYYTGQLNGGTPAMFTAQTQWVVDNRVARNIVYVAHVGDCVEHGDGSTTEWQRANTSLSLLENPVTTMLAEGIPYGLAVGNHDQSPDGDPNGTTNLFNQSFGASRFSGRTYYGGHYGSNNDNHYDLFSASGMDFIVVYLEYDPSANSAVLDWAENLLATHPTRRAIVVSHYLMNSGTQASFGSQGQQTYTALKSRPNLFLMLCGHLSEGRRTDTFAGNTVYTMMSDYQGRANGGDGWLRILEFDTVQDEIRVKTYSPTRQQFENDSDSQFTVPYEMQGSAGFQLSGSVPNVPSGGTAQFTWPNLALDTQYEWYVVCRDAAGGTTSATWRFTTAATFTIVASAGENGSIAPSGSIAIGSGDDRSFTITPNANSTIADVMVDGSSVGAIASYTFNNVTASHTIAATFAADTQGPVVQVTSPNGTESLQLYTTTTLTWTATDNIGITTVDLALSRGGVSGPFEPIATGIPNTGSYAWPVNGPGTTDAWLQVTARDAVQNLGSDVSDAAFEIVDTVSNTESSPVTEVALLPVAPNPTLGAARVAYALPAAGAVRLRVLDVRGRVVATLAEGQRNAGRYAVRWQGTSASERVAAGVYFIDLQAAGKQLTRRVLVMR